MQNWKIIVVEDTYDDQQLISAVLEYENIEVYLAHNGTKCLELLQNIAPTIIVTDLAMPQMDGWEMLKVIRANPTTMSIPVVAVSAYFSVDLARDAHKAGFTACFPKPISPIHFVQQLADILAS